MVRTVLAIAAGAVVGGTAVFLVLGASPRDAPTGLRAGSAPSNASGESVFVERLIDDELRLSDRAAVYEVASNAPIASVRAMLRDAADLSRSPERRFLIGALLTRIAETDAEEALALLVELDLDPGETHRVGLQVLTAMGTNARNIERVVAALPGLDADRFRLEALAALAERDPIAALALAQSPDGEPARDGIRAVAAALADQNPAMALGYADDIADVELRLAFVDRALRGLARADPYAAIAFVDGRYAGTAARPSLLQSIGRAVLQRDSRLAFDIGEAIGGWIGGALERQAIEAWARRAPLEAFAFAQAQPPTAQRASMMSAVAAAFGEEDPDAALAWARGLSPARPETTRGVLSGIARADPFRAIDLLEQGELPETILPGGIIRGGPDPAILRVMVDMFNSAPASGVAPAAIGERLLGVQDEQRRQELLDGFVRAWAGRDAPAAMDWLVANDGRFEPSAFPSLAQIMAASDPGRAMRLTDRLSSDSRDRWVGAVASGFALQDPAAALDWVAELRDHDSYERAAVAVVGAAAGRSPERTLPLLDTLSAENRVDAARAIAASWSMSDADAARDWITRTPPGPLRDAALSGYLGIFRNTAPDDVLLSMFSRDAERQQAVLRVINRLARTNASEALRLADAYVTDPDIRRAAGLVIATTP